MGEIQPETSTSRRGIPSYNFLAQTGSIHRRLCLDFGYCLCRNPYLHQAQPGTNPGNRRHSSRSHKIRFRKAGSSNGFPDSSETKKPAIHKTFENVAFEQMISEIASYYDLQVKFENNEDKTLRLYYEWNSHSSIENIVKELNQFENVNIELQQNELIVK